MGVRNGRWLGLLLCPCVGGEYVWLEYRYFFYKINLPFISPVLEMQVKAQVCMEKP